MRRSAVGDRLAFARLVEAHREALTAVAGRITEDRRRGGGHCAGGICTRLDPSAGLAGRPRCALSNVADPHRHNLAIDVRRQPAALSIAESDDPPDPSPAADVRLIERERAVWLAEAVASLPARQRAAIALVYDGGLEQRRGGGGPGDQHRRTRAAAGPGAPNVEDRHAGTGGRMTEDEFEELLDRYGGDPEAWPLASREAAERLLR